MQVCIYRGVSIDFCIVQRGVNVYKTVYMCHTYRQGIDTGYVL